MIRVIEVRTAEIKAAEVDSRQINTPQSGIREIMLRKTGRRFKLTAGEADGVDEVRAADVRAGKVRSN